MLGTPWGSLDPTLRTRALHYILFHFFESHQMILFVKMCVKHRINVSFHPQTNKLDQEVAKRTDTLDLHKSDIIRLRRELCSLEIDLQAEISKVRPGYRRMARFNISCLSTLPVCSCFSYAFQLHKDKKQQQ